MSQIRIILIMELEPFPSLLDGPILGRLSTTRQSLDQQDSPPADNRMACRDISKPNDLGRVLPHPCGHVAPASAMLRLKNDQRPGPTKQSALRDCAKVPRIVGSDELGMKEKLAHWDNAATGWRQRSTLPILGLED